ncbi:hypothetical protein KEM09_21780 [Carboxylicivirga mesophila]|uniref:Uncharacterized protein n=1 Tax=Carboxylicivirga mesophila TaxID=1166478 RepID=A0ABS5KIB4_9BACT|nr:hypothetical protein [Carboxylicivirga mesophila]MBS2214051.1 hypothetical protein [Carboxylicivirga mesophila]
MHSRQQWGLVVQIPASIVSPVGRTIITANLLQHHAAGRWHQNNKHIAQMNFNKKVLIFSILFNCSFILSSQTISEGSYKCETDYFEVNMTFSKKKRFILNYRQKYHASVVGSIAVTQEEEVKKACGTYTMEEGILTLKYEKYNTKIKPEYSVQSVKKHNSDSLFFDFSINQDKNQLPQPGTCVVFFHKDSVTAYGVADINGKTLIRISPETEWERVEISFIGFESILMDKSEFKKRHNEYSISIYLREPLLPEIIEEGNDEFRIIELSSDTINIKALYSEKRRFIYRDWALMKVNKK